jgi:hypothetical protein
MIVAGIRGVVIVVTVVAAGVAAICIVVGRIIAIVISIVMIIVIVAGIRGVVIVVIVVFRRGGAECVWLNVVAVRIAGVPRTHVHACARQGQVDLLRRLAERQIAGEPFLF